jgi:hypothetical protein
MAETVAELIQEGKDVTATLTDSEKVRLEECEQAIKKGLNTFLEVGEALAEIRDNRLYKETHKAFRKYCKDVWDLGKSTAQQKINGYKVVQLMKEKVDAIASISEIDLPENHDIVLQLNEAQARQIAKLKNPDDQVKALGLVLKKINQDPKPKLTAALINKVVKEIKGGVVKRKIKTTKKKVDATSLLSKQFKSQYQVMLEIIDAEKNNEWVTSKRKEVIKWLKTLVKIAESDD